MTYIIFVFKKLSLVLILCIGDVKWGIIRVTHFSANLISPFTSFFFLVNQKRLFFVFFPNHISYGISGAQVSPSTTVLVFHPSFLRGRDTRCFLKKKKTIISMNERRWKKKTTGTWWHAPCCSFNLVWWIYCYFISTRKNISFIG